MKKTIKSILQLLTSTIGISFTILLVTQCQQPRQTAESSPDPGAKLFLHYCAGCHLSNGSGEQLTPGGGVHPADIRQFTKTAPELEAIINNGFGKMPAFHDSTSADNISLIANYVATQIELHEGTAHYAPGQNNSSDSTK
jgi:mono/diheme cytochrome c family protein